MNGEFPEELLEIIEKADYEKQIDYQNVVGQDDLTRFDKPNKKKNRSKKKVLRSGKKNFSEEKNKIQKNAGFEKESSKGKINTVKNNPVKKKRNSQMRNNAKKAENNKSKER